MYNTYPFFASICDAGGPLRSRDVVGRTAIILTDAPQFSTHFLGENTRVTPHTRTHYFHVTKQ